MTGGSAGLVRTIGRWTLAGLLLNTIIGSGIFGVPSVVAGKLGAMAPLVWVVGAVAVGVIVACFAEVASRFDATGGPYLYARVAYGGFVGAQIGWLTYLGRVTGTATNVNLFVAYLGELWPRAEEPVIGGAIMVAFFGGLAVLNYRGVRQGAMLSNVLVIAKLLPLLALAIGGLVLVATKGTAVPNYHAAPTARTWLDAGILVAYAYSGFEATLVAAGEARNPQRDFPVALGVALGATVAVYLVLQMVVVWTLPDAPAETRPLAAAARIIFGPGGATLLALGALLSIYGNGTAAMVSGPRFTFAMAEHGDLPAAVGWVHPRFRTPAVSIILYAVIGAALATSGSFLKNLSVATVSRTLMYGLICLALPLLRRREGTDPRVGRAWFRLPGGGVLAWIGAAVCFVLVSRMTSRDAVIIGLVLAVGSVGWLLGPGRRALAARRAG